tara:strand:+ start:1158 stop:3173 length:2016 start_codon:yes stop_codon:yes gene_type:complete
MTELIITEKPSAAAKIAESFEGAKLNTLNGVKYWVAGDIVVASAVGHLFGLKKTERFYPVFNLEWKPSYEHRGSSFQKPYFQTLKSLGKKASIFTVATDYDIEGEVIGLNIIRELFKLKDANRMKFSTLTKSELRKAYTNKSKHLNWGQASAGVVRHNLDWYYGINLSQILSSSISKTLNRYQPMSIGRVQGPTLAILAEREIEIQKFKPVPFWQIFANLWLNSQNFQASHEKSKFWKKSEAENIFKKIKNKDGRVVSIKKAKQKIPVPIPFDLTSLQVESFRVFKYSPSMTLKIAQRLYTNALISYPRTSSQKLPKSLGLRKIVQNLGRNSNYSGIASEVLKTRIVPNEGRKLDPAHPSIYPTGELPKKLDVAERRVYDLIVRRFFSVFGTPGEREFTRVKMEIVGETFGFRGAVTTFQGWQTWYGPYVFRKELELPVLKVGQILKQNSELADKETQPPTRYNRASLVKLLEKEGLGTKSTRSQIIETLEKRRYIAGSPIEVTSFGLNVYGVFKKHASSVLSVKLTRKMDEAMKRVFDGKIKPSAVLSGAEKAVRELYAELKANSEKIGKALSKSFVETRRKQSILMPCHKCGGDLVIRVSRASKKRFIACNSYPKCKLTWPLPQRGVIKPTKQKCKDCNLAIRLMARTGRKPWFFCPNPDCVSKEKKDE